MFEFPVLVGDIGGTNARFALLEKGQREATVLGHERTADFPDPVAAIGAVLKAVRPRSALLAVAARVTGPEVQLTNASWVVDGRRIGPALGLSSVTVVNDYVPMAASLTRLEGRDLARLGPDLPAGSGGLLVLGPGTGFGAAALVAYGGRFAVVATEAGHTDLGPANDLETAFWPYLERVEGRVTVETVLSGSGLVRLYRALAALEGSPVREDAPNEVVEAGIAGTDPVAVRTLEVFGGLLGRCAGDLALTFGATGGVFVGSGIAPRMVGTLAAGPFRRAFESKAPFAALMAAIPTAIITAPDPAFAGLAALAADPERFAYEGQVWTA